MFTYTQVRSQLSVLCWHPKPSPVIQVDEGLVRVPGPVLLQEPPLEVRQHPVHVDQDPQSPSGSGGGRHVYANPHQGIREQSFASSEEAGCGRAQQHRCRRTSPNSVGLEQADKTSASEGNNVQFATIVAPFIHTGVFHCSCLGFISSRLTVAAELTLPPATSRKNSSGQIRCDPRLDAVCLLTVSYH